MSEVHILDATLRDGSYIVNDQFTADDTRRIVSSLQQIGFRFIEIGPGIGLNAKSQSTLKPASEDIEYIRAALEVAGNAQIGMFFIPGIGRMEDIKMAATEGLHFIRIGIDVDRYETAIPYVKYANQLGLMTTVNLMKSYAVTPGRFAEIAADFEANGIQVLYLVDSAGGMLPSEVAAYIKQTKDNTHSLKLGFHGHDNLSLAMANTLTAIEYGAEFVDSTIRGIGRSSGNANTEKLILILDRLGYEHHIDIEKLLTFSDVHISPFIENKNETTLDYVMGHSQFHSSYLSSIYQVAQQYNVSPARLIREYAQLDKIHMNETLLREVAGSLEPDNREFQRQTMDTIDVRFKGNNADQLEAIRKKFIELKYKFDRRIFFNLSKTYTGHRVKISPAIHEIEHIVFGSGEFVEPADFSLISEILDETVDGYLLDERFFQDMPANDFHADGLDRDKIYLYNDAKLFAESIKNHVSFIQKSNPSLNTVYVDIFEEVMAELTKQDLQLKLVDTIGEADIAVVGKNRMDGTMISGNPRLKWVLATAAGCLDPAVVEKHPAIDFIRIDFKREIYGEIIKNMHYTYLLDYEYGFKEMNGKAYCSGGYIGKKGTIVVNNIHDIKKIYGISNGDGSISYR